LWLIINSQRSSKLAAQAKRESLQNDLKVSDKKSLPTVIDQLERSIITKNSQNP